MSENEEKLTSEAFITMDICAQNDVECGLVNPMDHFWDVYILKTKMGQMLLTMMVVDSDPLSKNMLLQLPIILEVKSDTTVSMMRYGILSSDLFYYIPKDMIIGVFQASSEARKIYENGIEIYYKGVDQEKPKSSLKEAMFGIEDDLNSTEST